MIRNSLIPYHYRRELIMPNIDDESFYDLDTIPQPESPETAVARRIPYEASDLLKKLSQDRVTEKAMDTSAIITHDYLSSLSQEKLDQTKGINVSFERKRKFFSNQETGFDLSICLR